MDKSKHTVTIQRTFNAPIELVWEAWTQPKHIAKWWSPKGMNCEAYYASFTQADGSVVPGEREGSHMHAGKVAGGALHCIAHLCTGMRLSSCIIDSCTPTPGALFL